MKTKVQDTLIAWHCITGNNSTHLSSHKA